MDCAFYIFHFFEYWKHPGVYLWGYFGGLCSWTIFMGKPSWIEVQLMFWCGITFECVLRWLCLYLTFYMIHTILVMLCVVCSSVLCSAMTRKTHGPWTQYAARKKSVYLEFRGWNETCLPCSHESVSISGMARRTPLLLVVLLSSFQPFLFFWLLSAPPCLFSHVWWGQEDSFILMHKANRIINADASTYHPVFSCVWDTLHC